MHRSTIKTIGLLLFVPSAALVLMPLLASWTQMLDPLPSFSLSLGGLLVAELRDGPDGAMASAHPALLLPVMLGECALLFLMIARPFRTNRYSVSGARG